MTWQHVKTLPNVPEYSRFFFTDAERSDSEDRPHARLRHPDVVLLWEESRYSRKAVAEDRPDKANFRPYANSPEFDFKQN